MMKFILGLPLLASIAQAVQISVASSNANVTSEYQYGIMFEVSESSLRPCLLTDEAQDINRSIDGGLYAELIRNRAFYHSAQYPATIDPWLTVGGSTLSLLNTSTPLSSALDTSLRVSVKKSSAAQVGLANPGWWGISVTPQTYTGSFWVKGNQHCVVNLRQNSHVSIGSYSGIFTASLASNLTNQTFATTQIQSQAMPGQWTQHNFTLTPSAAAPNVNNTLTISFNAAVSITTFSCLLSRMLILFQAATKGYLDFNLISLFPPTYKNRANGNRVDLMQALADIKPVYDLIRCQPR
jgi:alpha-N-arabinofuranosidase